MSLDKAILHGKEHRKPYRGEKAKYGTCRNHGSCDLCKKGRMHKYRKREVSAEQELDEYEEESNNI